MTEHTPDEPTPDTERTGKVSDEMLMAFVDGELDHTEEHRIAGLAAIDAGIARRIGQFERSRRAVADAFAGVRNEPVPDFLVQTALGAIPLASRRPRPSFSNAFGWPVAVAASLVVVAGLGGFFAGQGIGTLSPAPTGFMSAATSPAVIEALAVTPSGQTVLVSVDGNAIETGAVGSYPTETGICRIFEARGTGEAARGVTCLENGVWSVALATVEPADGSYALASDAGIAAIDALLDALGAGAALDADSEAEAVAGGWR